MLPVGLGPGECRDTHRLRCDEVCGADEGDEDEHGAPMRKPRRLGRGCLLRRAEQGDAVRVSPRCHHIARSRSGSDPENLLSATIARRRAVALRRSTWPIGSLCWRCGLPAYAHLPRSGGHGDQTSSSPFDRPGEAQPIRDRQRAESKSAPDPQGAILRCCICRIGRITGQAILYPAVAFSMRSARRSSASRK